MKEEKIESQEVDEIREKIKKNKRINLILKIIFFLVFAVALGVSISMVIDLQREPTSIMNSQLKRTEEEQRKYGRIKENQKK